ncbi:adenylyltransferase/cytidyltransferase family protein [Pedobacter sp.]|uniref:adenylyltransferase/cytidyltransferase family protein n=1 Tax=Pedobacter sp. TaxID=1411316 RepID=UPI003D7FCE3D
MGNQEKDSKNVYVIGVFDLFHRGHVELLRRAKALGDKLIVAVNSDDMVSTYKRRPFFTEEDRLVLVESCKYVDEAFIIGVYDNKEYIQKYKIDIIVHGDDWAKESYMEQIRVDKTFMQAHNVQLFLLPYTNGISTSDLIKKIKETNDCKD